ncbi:adhesion G protein-coupled receptor F5 isoform X1 [Corvus kubaryi]|uniref:adhesion G protein-coupled receptor F5 isoform X1 n=1 Tax=Corvus kubaryi TaxID=68294 RepID=UPI001C03D29A|nr:adhesion G protein-coupled receptor F5 isoform X1 [Corvus kubaryi]XP_041888763.1 adhesion G protein-coupled receptor F5 isoform X1 [Corvus kubaryi]XP_041888764.1 adhesion G protein-coupled receptor F5 isoform X1 [Corvus kubaryi]XP_041888765.1 adhesion G protein-coupled receptor F5 isoform X1 [Corvus kubaryi]XP_041888767.1 adhesion G protein-coupled receptor F5 isoform X1 [Corvus kubaryi]
MSSPTNTGLHCLFLLVSACCQTPQGSNFYPFPYVIDSILEQESFHPEMQRQKRNMLILDLPLPEYTVDIEVSLKDSSYLDPIKDYFKNVSLTVPVNISNTQTTVSNISITTVCLPSGENNSCCFCENGYAWPSTVCSDVMPCPSLSLEPALPCGYTQKMPFYGPYCEPQTEDSCGMGEPIVMNMSVRLDTEFQDDLKDSSSVLYQKYKGDLEKAFNASYRCLPGFVSATVMGFSPGSVFVNYVVRTGAASFTQVGDSNRAVPQFLDSSYQLNPSTFTRVITNQTKFTVKPSNIFEGDTVTLTCEINSTFANATWYHSDQPISTSSRYSIETVLATRRSILKITNVTMKDSGSYRCIFILSSPFHTEIHTAKETVSVFPLHVTPNFEDIDVTCNSPEVQTKGLLLSCCIDRHLKSLKVSWKVNGTINITGESILSGNCTGYQLNINESLCPPEKSGAVTTYTCELETGHGARRTRSIGVTYLRKAHITISSSTNSTVSEGYAFNVTCESDVSNYDSISWKIQSGDGTKTVDCDMCVKNKFPATSVLTVKSATQDWRGTYICTFSQKNLESSANVTIEVISLPLKQNILIDPITTSIQCEVPHALECCISAKTVRDYRVTFVVQQNEFQVEKRKKDNLFCYMYNHTEKECKKEKEVVAYCKFINHIGQGVDSEHMRLHLIPGKKVSCSDRLGTGTERATLIKPCCDVKNPKGFTRGNTTYQCINSSWRVVRNDCLSGPINDLLSSAESLVNSPEAKAQLPSYLAQLKEQTGKELTTISNSSANLGAIVTILDMISSIPAEAEELTIQNFLSTVDLVVNDSTTEAWKNLSKENTQQSSLLLQSVENFSRRLQPVNNTIPSVSANTIQLQGTVVKENNNTDYNKDFRSAENLTVNVLISGTEIQTLTQNSTIVSVMYSKLGCILPQNRFEYMNGLLITTTLSNNRSQKFDVNMTFAKKNLSLKMPKCVFWNFTLNNHRGDWDTSGCTTTESGNYVICSCNHLTSFSILMSPDRSSEVSFEAYISYVGLAISIVSLVVCIIIESLVWKYVTNNTTSYMRHVCILNIATSLLIADVWFIVTASIDQNQQRSRDICIMATFFIHFFYLCVFFWMLSLGLILFYRLVFILHNTSKTAQKAVAFCLGYVCPFVIAVTTIAVTLPKNNYTRKDVCWLNWKDSKALLAFVIPALIIVAMNLFIAAVVIIKILRPTIGDRSSGQERKSLFQIGKSVAILTPLLGLTWGFGLATIIKNSHRAFHIVFALLNTFQGFFILVFGTLWDKKIQEALLKRNSSSKWSSQQSKSSSLILVTPMLAMSYPFSRTFNNLCGKTGKYRVSSSEPSTSSTENTSKAYSLLN